MRSRLHAAGVRALLDAMRLACTPAHWRGGADGGRALRVLRRRVTAARLSVGAPSAAVRRSVYQELGWPLP